MHAIASRALASGGARYSIHSGDPAWWVRHEDPRLADSTSYWLLGDGGFVALVEGKEINAFTSSGDDPHRLGRMEPAASRWQSRGGLGLGGGPRARVLSAAQRPPAGVVHALFRNGSRRGCFVADLGPGWVLPHVRGEGEADNRREASHRAFASTMDREAHLGRYLRFMRSPVYDRERDLVAVAPDGRVAAFMVWWSDPSGIARSSPSAPTLTSIARGGYDFAQVRVIPDESGWHENRSGLHR